MIRSVDIWKSHFWAFVAGEVVQHEGEYFVKPRQVGADMSDSLFLSTEVFLLSTALFPGKPCLYTVVHPTLTLPSPSFSLYSTMRMLREFIADVDGDFTYLFEAMGQS